jgi:hypothetical protein
MNPKMKRPAPDGFPATGQVILVAALGQRCFYQDRPSLSTDDNGAIHAEAHLPIEPFSF